MKTIFRVDVLDFDNMENRKPVVIRETRYYSSIEKINEYRKELDKFPRYRDMTVKSIRVLL